MESIVQIKDPSEHDLDLRRIFGLEYPVDNLRNMGFSPFFNPNLQHYGGSDWEGKIDGHCYHVTVGYPSRYPHPLARPVSVPFVTAHYEPSKPSSFAHLCDWLWSWWYVNRETRD